MSNTSGSDSQHGYNASVLAAKPYKSVYCVDNVDKSVDADTLTSFVSSLGVRVLSCFEVKPRMTARQRLRGSQPSHKTFRLCVNRADNSIPLQADSWHSDVSAFRWFFKRSSDPGFDVSDPALRQDLSLTVSHAENTQSSDADDMDTTILVGPASLARLSDLSLIHI